ncbi:MAG TPA: ABC transporter permease, partial [Burkholderiaceae bacterium]|nr:ABC transporter permease [Burkholderiaceae bacterium]
MQLSDATCTGGEIILEGSSIESLDSAGAWVLSRWLSRHGARPQLRGWPPRFEKLMALVATHPDTPLPQPERRSFLYRVGAGVVDASLQALALLGFIGESAMAALRLLAHPRRIRWRTSLRNIQIGGFEALPIIGLTSFLLGIVVAYQGADQLRHYGANIFVVELVGYSMLREFAPLITAIIIAGRSGSAYA